jgi:hypothetical protein
MFRSSRDVVYIRSIRPLNRCAKCREANRFQNKRCLGVVDSLHGEGIE